MGSCGGCRWRNFLPFRGTAAVIIRRRRLVCATARTHVARSALDDVAQPSLPLRVGRLTRRQRRAAHAHSARRSPFRWRRRTALSSRSPPLHLAEVIFLTPLLCALKMYAQLLTLPKSLPPQAMLIPVPPTVPSLLPEAGVGRCPRRKVPERSPGGELQGDTCLPREVLFARFTVV